MANDSYKGESLQKKDARFQTHHLARSYIDQRAPTGMSSGWEHGLHVVLASREGGDIGVLNHLGVPFGNIVAVDRCTTAIRACADKWEALGNTATEFVTCPSIATEVGWLSTCLQRWRDKLPPNCGGTDGDGGGCWVAEWAARSKLPFISSVFMDFCGHIDKSTMDECSYAWACMSRGSVLSVAFLKGREKVQQPLRVAAAPFANRHMRRRQYARDAAFATVGDMMRGAIPWDSKSAMQSLRDAWGAENGRLALVHAVLRHAAPDSYPRPMAVIEYQSRTESSRGVPMVIMQFAKERHASQRARDLVVWKASQAESLAWRNDLLAKLSSHDAAMALNVPERTAAAWKAHATRGTYARAA
jgi:hypothetical protein